MSSLIEAVQAQRQELLVLIADQLAVLDEIERLAAGLAGAGPDGTGGHVEISVPAGPPPDPRALAEALGRGTPRAAAKAKPKATAAAPRVGRDGLGGKAASVLEALRANGGWMSRAELVAVTGDFNNKTLQTLVTRELAEAQGVTNSRRYRATRDDSDTATGGTAPPVRTKPRETTVAVDGLDAKATRILRARILDHLSRRRLTDQSLADHLNAELDHVKALLAELVVAGEVERDAKGLYQVPTS